MILTNTHKEAHHLAKVVDLLISAGTISRFQFFLAVMEESQELITQVAMLYLAEVVAAVLTKTIKAVLAVQALLAATAGEAKAIQTVMTGKHLAAAVVERKTTPQAAAVMASAGC
tara:strand:- start:20 stop:364 length:345 start_codon:yes stop_codon:yes gene_type:complete